MWISVLVVLGGMIYLAWCLVGGKIFVTLGTDLHKNTKLVEREDRPGTFWITWVASAIALTLLAFYLIRTLMK
jgi:hypothetical protein